MLEDRGVGESSMGARSELLLSSTTPMKEKWSMEDSGDSQAFGAIIQGDQERWTYLLTNGGGGKMYRKKMKLMMINHQRCEPCYSRKKRNMTGGASWNLGY